MTTTQTTTLPDFVRRYADRMRGARQAFAVRLVKSPEGGTIARLSWRENEMARGGYVEERETVLWVAWAGAVYVGQCSTRRAAAEKIESYFQIMNDAGTIPTDKASDYANIQAWGYQIATEHPCPARNDADGNPWPGRTTCGAATIAPMGNEIGFFCPTCGMTSA